ncbi:UNVERIFIED_CONTAM: hypothetical protein K2H54_061859 [Gekko kuhli]
MSEEAGAMAAPHLDMDKETLPGAESWKETGGTTGRRQVQRTLEEEAVNSTKAGRVPSEPDDKLSLAAVKQVHKNLGNSLQEEGAEPVRPRDASVERSSLLWYCKQAARLGNQQAPGDKRGHDPMKGVDEAHLCWEGNSLNM